MKPGLKTQNFMNLSCFLGRTGCLLKLELTKSNESGHEYKRTRRSGRYAPMLLGPAEG